MVLASLMVPFMTMPNGSGKRHHANADDLIRLGLRFAAAQSVR